MNIPIHCSPKDCSYCPPGVCGCPDGDINLDLTDDEREAAWEARREAEEEASNAPF